MKPLFSAFLSLTLVYINTFLELLFTLPKQKINTALNPPAFRNLTLQCLKLPTEFRKCYNSSNLQKRPGCTSFHMFWFSLTTFCLVDSVGIHILLRLSPPSTPAHASYLCEMIAPAILFFTSNESELCSHHTKG